MSIASLTPERALELLREVVAEFGADYAYRTPDREVPDGSISCFYVHGDRPGCIAGHVLHRAGLTLEQLNQQEYRGADHQDFVGYGVPPAALMVLRKAQIQQDNGRTWGEALVVAQEYYASTQEG